jgi:D-serine deaminase-like pyridoxal phosphate-dependent protein
MSTFAAAERTSTGRTVDDLETPAAVVDLDRLDRNLERVAAYAAEHELGLYPHTKTHKTLEIAARQLELGARGLTVAKSEEAESYAELGAPLLVHSPVVGAAKVDRIVALAGSVPVTVAVDSLAAAEPLALALIASGGRAEALVEVDVGLRRTGVEPAAAAELAAAIEGIGGGLEVAGISCYPGHLRHDEAAILTGLEAVDRDLRAARDGLEARGIDCRRISGGSTATLFESHRTPMTELRPGNYALLDRQEARGAFGLDDCALRVISTVISTSVPGRIVLDAGSKVLSESPPPPGAAGFGAVAGRPEITIEALSEEHAHGVVGAAADAGLQVGARVELIPNHACTCVNHQPVLFGVRGRDVVAELRPRLRGALR